MTQVLVSPGEVEGGSESLAEILRPDWDERLAVPAPWSPAPWSPAPLAPGGWYPDPSRLRYWDGRDWTEETCPRSTGHLESETTDPVEVGLLGVPPFTFGPGARVSGTAVTLHHGSMRDVRLDVMVLIAIGALAVAMGALVASILGGALVL